MSPPPDPSTRPVLVAPDAFKGTFTAEQAAELIASGIEQGGLHADRCPLADGGEGTAAVLRAALGGTTHEVVVCGPRGEPVTAQFTLLDAPPGKRRGPMTAVLDMASASGLPLVPAAERDPLQATTFGTGELILAALEAGAGRVLIGCGGSATVDGGAGAIEAIEQGGGLRGAQLLCITDVRTTWAQCAATFGPQKGATAATLPQLERRLRELATSLPIDPSQLPGSGAAGGLAGGLHAAFGAAIEPGAPFVLAATGADARMRAAAFVIVGEGRIDRTSLRGKVPGELATRARQAGVPCSAVVGQNQITRFDARIIDLMEIIEATDAAQLTAAGATLAERWLAATTPAAR